MHVPFRKMHGCGNDFVILDARAGTLGLTPARAAAIADRHFGVGCDQIILISPPEAGADAFIRICNPDGSEAGACGNATRCVASLLAGESGARRLVIRTTSGDLPTEILSDGQVRVDMGRARLEWDQIPLAHPMDTLHLPLACGSVADPAACSMGNPHATFFVPDVMALDISAIGPALEKNPIFPDRANIGFAHVLSPGEIRLRVWERGAGLTLACGSGACAAMVNAHRRGLVGRRTTIIADGGVLELALREDDHVLMTGPVATSFTGMLEFSDDPS
ncbi:MAG: diaminopimelate epimerase [Acetobacteraceae bacterium]|nr:diaminopimelate epimerase [Acetobacteraceae bacterium]